MVIVGKIMSENVVIQYNCLLL